MKKAAPAPVFRRDRDENQPTPSFTFKKTTNPFDRLEGVNTRDEAPRKEGKWGMGTKMSTEPEPVRQRREEPEKYERPKDDKKWGIGSKKTE